jgi:CO/xanthine dehydrogenase Mo-binding subunit/aerobic-type carbon monoxide dehydrogenase small subunit (CoxS/CutS family)
MNEKKEMIAVKFKVNGKDVEAVVPEGMLLLHYLRTELKLFGTKNGCSTGHCGTCTVIMDGKARRACLIRVSKVNGAQIETIEALSQDGTLHPLQQAFIETNAAQCGFCTPGMIMTAKALLDVNPRPSREEILKALTSNNNLCRCTGYVAILDAVQLAAERIQAAGQADILPEAAVLYSNPQLRQRAIDKTTGSLAYGDDIVRENMLYGKILWAQHPHARILRVDTSKAEALEGVVKVLTAKDIPGRNQCGLVIRDQPAIAEDKVRYIGDSVASVFAESLEIATEALSQIEVEYDVLPAVFTPQDAARPNAPQVHEKGNLLRHAEIVRGDVEEAYKKCAVIVENTYSTPFIEHGFLEPESGLAYPDGEGGVVLEMGTQTVFDDRAQLAEILDIPEEKIRVIQIPQGGSFGAKEDFILQQHLCLAALLTNRPVKMVLTREESLRVHVKRHPTWIYYKTGADEEGNLLVVKADVILDTGAYASLGIDVLENVVVFGAGPYFVPNLKITGHAWYTNNVLCGAMRGFGVNQVAIGLEQQIDEMARALNMDPFEFRIKNSWRAGLPTAADHLLEEGVDGIKETIEAAREAFRNLDLPLAGGKKIGIGVAAAVKNVGFGHGIPESTGAILELENSGAFTLKVTHHEYGQGGQAGQIKIASNELDAPVSQFTLIGPDTAVTPETGPSTASRQTFLTGCAVALACRELKNQVFGHAAELLDVSPDQLKFEGGQVIDKKTGKAVALKELGDRWVVARSFDSPETHQIYEGEPSRWGKRSFQTRITHVMYSYTAQVAVVSVDEKTGEVKVLKIISANDLGKVLNPQIVKGQIEGASLMGIGFALSEQYLVENGWNITDRLNKIRLPKADQMPEIIPIFVEVPHPLSPEGMKGFAEAPSLATAPAILNAIYDAVGVRIRELPADKKKVLEAIRHRQT